MNFNYFTGSVTHIGEPQTFGENFTKAELHIKKADPSSKREQYVNLEVTGRQIDLLSELTVGDVITVQFAIGGRKWEDKIFNTVTLLSFDIIGGADTVEEAEPAKKTTEAPMDTQPNQGLPEDNDSLPF